MATACWWLSGMLSQSFRDHLRIRCLKGGCLDRRMLRQEDAETEGCLDRGMLRQPESTLHSFLQSISPGWPRRHECQLSFSSFHNLMKDWSPKSVGHSSFWIRKYSSKPKLGCHKSSLYTILHHHPQLPERVYLETKTFPRWMQAQSNFFLFFFLVKCGGSLFDQFQWLVFSYIHK